MCLFCLLGTDGFCPFKDNKLCSLWPLIIIFTNLPESERYDPRNIIILYVATSITGGQPRNFFAHLELVVKELAAASVGFKIGVRGVPTTVHLVVPVVSCDGPGPPPLTHPPL